MYRGERERREKRASNAAGRASPSTAAEDPTASKAAAGRGSASTATCKKQMCQDATISVTALLNNNLVGAQGQTMRAATDAHTLSPSLPLFLTRHTIISDLSLS